MKFGIRTPNLKKRFKARTTGKLKRQLKRSFNPFYGKKGMGLLRNPKRAFYNKIYNKTSVDIFSMAGSSRSSKKQQITASHYVAEDNNYFYETKMNKITRKRKSYLWVSFALLFLPGGVMPALIVALLIIGYIFNHNKKPSEESVVEKELLTAVQKYQVKSDVEELAIRLNELQLQINRTLDPDKYFTAIQKYRETAEEITRKIEKYHLPLNYKISLDLDGQTVEFGENDMDDLTEKVTSGFIERYFADSKESAAKLKTIKGYSNRMERKKESLNKHSDMLNPTHRKLIDSLWKAI